MADNFKYVQAQPFALAGAGAIIGVTSFVLKSFAGVDGVLLTMTNFGTIGFGTLEPGNGTLEEQICFTGVSQNANGTATLTGVSSVSFISPYTKTSGLLKTHAGSTEFVISNTSGFYDEFVSKDDDETIAGDWTFSNHSPTVPTEISSEIHRAASIEYANALAIAGAPDASTTVKGISKLSSVPVSPTNPIAVGDTDTRVPTQGENDAMVGNNIDVAVGSGNKYVTQTGLIHSAETYAADAQASDTYVITLSPVPAAYSVGMQLKFKANTVNTGVATLNVNGLGAVTIVKGVSTTLANGDIAANQICNVVYDGTTFVLMNPSTPVASSIVSAASAVSQGTGVSTTQNIDTVVSTTFTPKTITVYYKLKGFLSSGTAQYQVGIATFNGTSIVGNMAFQNGGVSASFQPTSVSFLTSAPSAGGDAANGGITVSIVSLSSTGFTLRVTYTQGTTFNGGDYAVFATATA